MPNIKSAKKRVLVINKKTEQNKAVKSALKTQLKKFGAADNKEELLGATVSFVDSSAAKGVIHKNKANRMKAQLAKKASDAAK